MRLPVIAHLLITTSALAAQPYGYEWMTAEPSRKIVQQAGALTESHASQAWRLSVGYAVRNFEADFKMSSPSIGLIAPYLGGFGDVGLYRGGSGVLNYEDGYVGPSNGDGTADGRVTSTWLTPGNEQAEITWDTSAFHSWGVIVVVGPGYESATTETFHTKTFEMLNRDASTTAHGHGAGSYLRLNKTIAEGAFGGVGLSVAWTHLEGLLDQSASFGHPIRIDNNYTYDRASFIGLDANAPWIYGLVVDADAVNALHEQGFGTPGHYRNPRKSITRYEVPEWTAIGRSFLDVRLNEIFLSADAVWKPGRGWELGLSAGPTVNVVSTTLNSRTAWVHSSGSTVPGESMRQSETHVAAGLGVQGVVRRDLSPDGRAFIEAHAGYKWMNDIAVGSDASSAKLDLSDWEVGIGVGIRLDDWPAGSPWTVKAGVNTRTLSFRSGAADTLALRSFFNRSSVRGDVGLAGPDSAVTYDDGEIRAGGIGIAGSLGLVDHSNPSSHSSSSQFNPHTGRYDNGKEIGQMSYHSSFTRERFESLRNVAPEVDQHGVAAMVEMDRSVAEWDHASLSLGIGFEAMNSSFQTGPELAAIADVRATTTLFSYQYDYSQPYADLGGGLGVITFANPAISPYLPPRHSSSTSIALIHYFALTSASVDVSMQTLPITTELAWKPIKRFEVGVVMGPTLNLVNTSTDLTTDWIRQDGLLLARLQNHKARTDFKLGLRLQASARYDLTPEGRWFVEARGGYEWMQNIDLGIGLQAATLDATSWQVGGAFGCRLGVKARLPEIRDLRVKAVSKRQL